MICPNCGSPTQAGENFCGTCGSFLAWESDDSVGETDSASSPPDQASADPATTPAQPTPPPAPPHTGSESRDAGDSAGQEQPAAVQPAMPQARRPVVRLSSTEPTAEPDAAPCRVCGTPNPPDRRFCRRCGATLSAPAVAAKPSWWQRVRPSRAARRRLWSALARIVQAIIALALVIFVVVVLVRFGPHWLDEMDQFVQRNISPRIR
jgi:hypothetical protein